MRPTEKSLRFTSTTIKTIVSLGLFLVIVIAAKLTHAGDAPLVRANYAAFSGAFAPLWIAADKNLFGKYGLNVDIRYIAPATATQALIGKNLEIINPGGEIVEAGLSGEPVIYIAGILNRAVMSVYAKPEIGSLADLKGKVLAVTVPGATTDFAARVLLQQARLTPGKDVKLLYLKGMVEILAGINQGHADAGIFTSPTTLKAQHAGLKELVNVTEQNIPMIHAALASTKGYLKTQPDNVRRFLQAYLEGIKFARTDAA
jgi:ABC-type nitrate/sulfonate/bicarbonate transport system substrate-binding protein